MPQLQPLLALHLTPIERLLLPRPRESAHLEVGFLLRCFQQLSTPHLATQRFPCSYGASEESILLCTQRALSLQ